MPISAFSPHVNLSETAHCNLEAAVMLLFMVDMGVMLHF